MLGDGASYDFVYQPHKFIPNIARPNRIELGGIENLRISTHYENLNLVDEVSTKKPYYFN